MRRRALTASAVVVAVAVALVVTLNRGADGRDATPLATVTSYLRALSGNDRDALAALAEPSGRGRTAGEQAMIDDQLARYGGKPLVVASVAFVNALWATVGGACQAVFRGTIGGQASAFVIGMQVKPEGGWQVTFVDERFPAPDTPGCT
ncbi:hypothetical protein ACFO1B_23040 [Dactylosporangium siamense]|uniref:Uncharacterized protein n=1 Tax=Dactylosporangium siamense TaxID=685454 RepID=A0A919PLX2_9ACTN|nr:hypothetical protein [Dactylosporangium siamense]GIG47071.1 hypothetical protein Dsi01nite_051120 [Dactylosporangium siamense]